MHFLYSLIYISDALLTIDVVSYGLTFFDVAQCVMIGVLLTLAREKPQVNDLVWFMVFNATFNNISVISWRSVLLVV